MGPKKIWSEFPGWGKGPCWDLGHFLVGMGEGAMLESGTFSCGDGGRGHVGIWDIFLWDPRPLGWLFGAFRLLEIRNAFVSGFICSEKD